MSRNQLPQPNRGWARGSFLDSFSVTVKHLRKGSGHSSGFWLHEPGNTINP